MDADTKLVPSWLVGLRDADYAHAFINDLKNRLANRVQITTDGQTMYIWAIEDAFGSGVDFGMLVKLYGSVPEEKRRYSPAKCISAEPHFVYGNPDKSKISTSFVESQNLTMRMNIRRFTRLTNALSEKLENHTLAVALYFMHYNFVRPHQTLANSYPRTPAMASGVTNRIWTIEDIAKLTN